ncbi:hypothetical protein AB0399_18995 [Streptomyces sp. NPDC088194]|uniref:DUF6907 domain-containing protein n=1 Tax=Streptomyces sp. NPDC088194 TaxID=3154931 RepID=UPI003450DFCF
MNATPSSSALPAPATPPELNPKPRPNPKPKPARRWAITTTTGDTAIGHLPDWASTDPSEHDVPPHQLAARLADINHHVRFPGQVLRVYSPANSERHPMPVEVLHTSIDCNPYAPDPEPRVPVANLHLAGEYWLTDLDPEELGHLAGSLRTLADRLDHQVRPTLVAARSDWTRHPSRTTGTHR